MAQADFPKSHDISKGIDKAGGDGIEGGDRPYLKEAREKGYHDMAGPVPVTEAAKEWDGYGTALKPAWEPIVLAMKPLDGTFAENAQKHGVAGLWIDGGRVWIDRDDPNHRCLKSKSHMKSEGKIYGPYELDYQISQDSQLKSDGRWPANVVHDGSEEVVENFPADAGAAAPVTHRDSKKFGTAYGSFDGNEEKGESFHGDTGSAARFFQSCQQNDEEKDLGFRTHSASRMFYCAKASTSERTADGLVDNNHATVKPLALMRWLCRLTRTPGGGILLDPFMGSGTTLMAAYLEDRKAVGIERDEASCEIAAKRLEEIVHQGRLDFGG